MADYKVVDAQQLDAGMTATANAIREKTGGSAPIAWDAANGFKAAVEEIDERGVVLPELGDTAAKPTDMVFGKVLYDDEGNPVTGELYEIPAGEKAMAPFEELHGNPGDTVFSVSAVYQKNVEDGYGVIIRKGTILTPRNIPTSLLGTAATNQVAKGVTFTSAAGLLMDGGLEDIAAGRAIGAIEDVTVKSVSDGTIRIMAKTNWGDEPGCIVRSGAYLSITAPESDFADIFPAVDLNNGILSIR